MFSPTIANAKNKRLDPQLVRALFADLNAPGSSLFFQRKPYIRTFHLELYQIAESYSVHYFSAYAHGDKEK